MNDTAQVLEVMPEQKELLVVIEQNALPAEAAQSLTTSFAPSFKEAGEILAQSRQIVVTSPDQKLQIKLARDYRLALRAIRVGADKKRKELKDVSLRQGRAIDGFFNILLHLTDTEEQRLAAQEEFVERQEAARKEALKVERTKFSVELGIDPNLYQLGDMSEETFQNLIEGTRLARAAQAERERKAEAERIALAKAEAEERERIRLENERLKAEAAEKEAALKAERERVAAEQQAAAEAARQEQAAREAAEAEKERLAEIERKRIEAANAKMIAEMKAKMEAEKAAADKAAAEAAEAARQERLRLHALAEVERQKTEAARAAAETAAHNERVKREHLEAEARAKREEEEAAARKAAAAPDKEKLLAFATAIRAVELPVLTSESALHLVATLVEQREKLAAWIEKKAEAL